MGSDARCWRSAVITVFFSLLCAVMLSFLFVLLESIRFAGARAQVQHLVSMGHFSLFSEYEKKLLTDFELFAVDGSYGSGDFSTGRITDRLHGYIQENALPDTDGIASLCFDPWQISPGSCHVTDYTLLTDDGAACFYQQAVAYMRQTAVTGILSRLLTLYHDSQQAKEFQDIYEKEKYAADKDLKELEKQEAEKKKELESEAQESGQALVPAAAPPNPIPALARLARRDLLSVTCGNVVISDRSVARTELASARKQNRGTLKLPKKYGGLLNDLLFREYLLDHFGYYLKHRPGLKLSYETEYLLGGKKNDRDNLKAVIRRLLLLREGCNYVYCTGDEVMNGEAETLAFLLTGWTGIPALTAILKHALLLGWAYGESLLDVRILMRGGRVPLFKQEGQWQLSLSSLAFINELLDEGGKDYESGLDYRGYLRILLNLQRTETQKKRGLDLIELRIRSTDGLSNFRVDNLLIAIRDETEFSVPPVFSNVAAAFLHLGRISSDLRVVGSFAY